MSVLPQPNACYQIANVGGPVLLSVLYMYCVQSFHRLMMVFHFWNHVLVFCQAGYLVHANTFCPLTRGAEMGECTRHSFRKSELAQDCISK